MKIANISISRTSIVYLISILFVSMAISLFVPVAALCMSEEVSASKFQIGAFFTIQALFTIVLTQVIAKYSDITGNRNNIIIWGCICGSITCLIFAFCRNYWIILLVGAFIYSMSHIAAQVFASAREYCIYTKRNVYTFNSILRAFFALAWVIGPPIALMVVDLYGFAAVYLGCIGVYAIISLMTIFALPKTKLEDHKSDEIKKIKLFEDRSVILLCLATMFVFVCNNMYMITMPQYVTHELGFSKKYVGLFMAMAAGIEIPIMLISSQIARRISSKYILMFATFSGIIYYIIISNITSISGFFVAQIANALFIGIFTTLGMLYFQELLPRIPGQATTLFTNSIAIGTIAAGGISGIIAENFGFLWVFYANAVVSLLSLICMSLVRKIQ